MHSSRSSHRRSSKSKRACSLYSSPTSSQTLGVFEPTTITWNPSCLTSISGLIDLYLSVNEASGVTPVHLWSGVDYSKGSLSATFQPGWWNASTGAGSVRAQFTITPTGSPIWDTSAPVGPSFTIAYNGSYPASVTGAADFPVYTGPSVTGSEVGATGITPGQIGAAVALPLLAIAAAVGGYIAWNKYKNKPEKKRWSAVVDKRVSMMSQSTWQSRPNSMAPASPLAAGDFSAAGDIATLQPSFHRPSGSLHSTSRHSFFADGRPNSAYSVLPSAPSPLGLGIPRALPPPNMRQIGAGERMSKVSFAGGEEGRTSFSSNRSKGNRSSMHGTLNGPGSRSRSTSANAPALPSAVHHSRSKSIDSSSSSPSSTPVKATSKSPFAIQEELADLIISGSPSPTKNSWNPTDSPSKGSRKSYLGHRHQSSVGSSLRQEVSSKPSSGLLFSPTTIPSSPLDTSSTLTPTKSRARKSMSAHMPTAFGSGDSPISPDEAMATYAVKLNAAAVYARHAAAIADSGSTSKSGGRFGKLIKGLGGKKASSSTANQDRELTTSKPLEASPLSALESTAPRPPLPNTSPLKIPIELHPSSPPSPPFELSHESQSPSSFRTPPASVSKTDNSLGVHLRKPSTASLTNSIVQPLFAAHSRVESADLPPLPGSSFVDDHLRK